LDQKIPKAKVVVNKKGTVVKTFLIRSEIKQSGLSYAQLFNSKQHRQFCSINVGSQTHEDQKVK